MKSSNQNVKKSLILSGLVGTGGIFIAKAIGLIYSIPFSDILGSDAYMSYYGSAYRVYSYLLNVFTAGFPFAIATLVAKYGALKNYRTVLEVKRVATLFMMLIGFLGMVIMMAISSLIAPLMTETADGVHVMTVVLCILAVAIFFVPILSSYRGFVQGCKEMQEYAFSQAFEQIFRVGFLLSVSCLMVYGLGMARVWALYAAVLSTSVAAVAGLVQIMRFTRKKEGELQAEAAVQTMHAIPLKPLFHEFFWLAMPYMVSAVLGYSDDIYNAILLPVGLRYSSYDAADIATVMSAVNYVGTKLTAIPMILAPGFSAAIIPHISAALVEEDYKKISKNIRECVGIVAFIGLFLSFSIFLYSPQLFHCLFYTSDLPLSAYITKWCAIEGFMNTIVPVVSSMMMALRLQNSLLKRLAIGCILKGILMVPFTALWGFPGTVLTTLVGYGYILVMNMVEISRKFHVNFTHTLNVIIRTALGLVGMGLVGWGLTRLGLGTVDQSRLLCLGLTIVNGLAASAVFAVIVLALHVPQTLFHFKLKLKH